MKHVVFFIDHEWAFGSIHHELAKYLWPHNYNCYVLPWEKRYTKEEILELNDKIDLWVVNPHGYMFLKYAYNIPPDKCSVIAHAPLDMEEYGHKYDLRDFDYIRHFGVTSNYLKQYAKYLKINREPVICSLGLNYNSFHTEPNRELKTIGFAGSYHEREEFSNAQIQNNLAQPKYKKRGYLVREIAAITNLNFSIASRYHNSFITMPGFYKSVDCVIVASTEEGYGLPLIEAGAAGKLVIGTPVGCWNDLLQDKGGIQVPIDENLFMEKAIETLLYYKDRPAEYRDKCKEIQEHAKKYDWSYHIDSWLQVLK